MVQAFVDADRGTTAWDIVQLARNVKRRIEVTHYTA